MLSALCLQSAQWAQVYDPAHHLWLSTLVAASPLIVLMLALAVFRIKAHLAAGLGAGVCLCVAIFVFGMPARLAFLAASMGVAYGTFPIFWIIFPVIFLYQLTVRAGRFQLLEGCITGITQDGRLQLLLIAFSLGAFFEGVAGFGAPVAICGTLLLGFGFSPVRAAGLALLGNTAPVAFGSLGIPVIALAGVTALDLHGLTVNVATMLTPFYLIVPWYLVVLFAGWTAALEVWPALVVAGASFCITETVISRLHGPWLMDIAAAVGSILCLLLLFRFWKPKRVVNAQGFEVAENLELCKPDRATVVRALVPWVILTVGVTLWGLPSFTHWVNTFSTWNLAVPGLDHAVLRVPPAVTQPAAEAAVFVWNPLSASGTGIFLMAWIAAFAMGLPVRVILRTLWETVMATRFAWMTITALMSIGFVSRYCGLDATMGLAFAATGALYPVFGTFIGWVGTASTGSDTSSNVLFGSLQKLTAQQLGLSPVLMAGANSAGGVMGKMVSPQNIVVASTATGSYGKEGSILRFVILHSLLLTLAMSGVVLLLARWHGLAKAVLP